MVERESGLAQGNTNLTLAFRHRVKIFLTNDKYLLLLYIICLTSFFARILFSLKIGEITGSEDMRIALNIARYNTFSFNPEIGPTALKAPLYPYFLAFFMFFFGSKAIIAVSIIQHMMFSFTPLLLYKTCILLRDKVFGFFCALIFVFYPSFFVYPNTIEVASISIPFAVLSLYLIILSVKKNPKVLNLSALCSGILCLLQPLFFIVLIIFYLFMFLKKRTKHEFLALIIFMLILSPWIVRNYLAFNKFIFIKSPFWQNVYTGFMPEYHMKEEFDAVPDSVKTYIEESRKKIDDVEMEERYKSAILPIIRSDPGLYMKKTFYQLYCLWWAPPKYGNDRIFAVFRLFPLSLIYLFSIPGLLKTFGSKNKSFYSAIIFTIFYFSMIYAMTFALNVRFKLEFEWLLFFFAAYGFILLLQCCRPGKDQKSSCRAQPRLS